MILPSCVIHSSDLDDIGRRIAGNGSSPPFFWVMVHRGQRLARALDVSPRPKDLQQLDKDRIELSGVSVAGPQHSCLRNDPDVDLCLIGFRRHDCFSSHAK